MERKEEGGNGNRPFLATEVLRFLGLPSNFLFTARALLIRFTGSNDVKARASLRVLEVTEVVVVQYGEAPLEWLFM